MTDVARQMAAVLGRYICPRFEDHGVCTRSGCQFLHPRSGLLGAAQTFVKRPKPFPRKVCLVHAESRRCLQTNAPVVGSGGQEFYSCPVGFHPTQRQFGDLSKFFVDVGSALHRTIAVQPMPCPLCQVPIEDDQVGVLSDCSCYYHLDCALVAFLLHPTLACPACRVTSRYYVIWNKATNPPSVVKKESLVRSQRMSALVNELNNLTGRLREGQPNRELLKNYNLAGLQEYYRGKITPDQYDSLARLVETNRILMARAAPQE